MGAEKPGMRVRFSRVHPTSEDSTQNQDPKNKEKVDEDAGRGNTHRDRETVILNVGGINHRVKWETIDKFPKSRLQNLKNATSNSEILLLCDSYFSGSKEFYFDRSPRIFESILGLYRKGELHLTEGVCPVDFLGELDYWGLSALHLDPCCAYTLQRSSWLLPAVDDGNDENTEEVDQFKGKLWGETRGKLWKLFEDPNSSFAAKVLVIVNSVFLISSILLLILSTIPQFQNETENKFEVESYFFHIAEAIFVGWFTLEYVIRFAVAPQKFEFLISFLNIIDLLGILPFFTSLALSLLFSQYSLEYIAKATQIFRILRILRIFKLSRHITGLKTLGTTLKNSHRELLLLSMTISMGMLIFASMEYFLEKDEPDSVFYSLPQALYWAIITMTSTGYGDLVPKTGGGKLVASLCAICGVLCITLPIPIIVANFNRHHEKVKLEDELNEVRERQKAEWEETKYHIKFAKNGATAGGSDINKPKPKINGYFQPDLLDNNIHM